MGSIAKLLDASFQEKPEEELANFHELDQMILENVFIPDPLDIALPDSAPSSPRMAAADPQAEAHRLLLDPQLPAPTTRQLFHIHAEEFGESSELEGSQSKEAVNYLAHYLRGRNGPPELIEELENALSPKDVEPPQEEVKSSSLTFLSLQKEMKRIDCRSLSRWASRRPKRPFVSRSLC